MPTSRPDRRSGTGTTARRQSESLGRSCSPAQTQPDGHSDPEADGKPDAIPYAFAQSDPFPHAQSDAEPHTDTDGLAGPLKRHRVSSKRRGIPRAAQWPARELKTIC